MPSTPYQVHEDTLSNYLGWLTLFSSGNEAENLLPGKFTWPIPSGGAEYSCNYSLVQQRDLQPGGYTPMDDLVLEVLQPMPEPGPQSEQLVTFKAKNYRIRTVKKAAGKHPQLICYDPARGM